MSNQMQQSICLVEDDEIMGESLCDRFALEGFKVDWHQTGKSALDSFSSSNYCMIISDIRLPDLNGEEIFTQIMAQSASPPPFIFITGYGSIDQAVQLLKKGAADYITKPFDLDQLIEKVQTLGQTCRSCTESSLEDNILGISPAMQKIQESIPRLAKHASTILITGDSGAGKEHVALQIHKHSREVSESPFVAVNCGALTESLMEAELFGHEKGAFTGAIRARKGVFEQADGGTLFLDEIGELPLAMQVKLLRAIQERRIVRVGGEASIKIDVRLVCATNRDLKKMVEQGTFREDLYYRINVIHLRVPPLRERKEDLLWFAQLFLREYAAAHGEDRRVLHPRAERALLEYEWPGNLRELKHSIERACILSKQTALEPEAFFDTPPALENISDASAESGLADHLRECERRHILQALELNQWHFGHTAEHLNISRKNLWEKMKKLNIQTPE